MSHRARKTIVLILSVAWIAGCAGEASSTSLIRLPPPPTWESDMLAARASKDRYFRTSQDTPLLATDVSSFGGLDYFDPDTDYYFVGSVRFYDEPERLDITTTAGKIRPCEKIGWISFPLDGEARRLQVYRLLDSARRPDDPGFFLPFTDATTGDETYPTGRYLDLYGPVDGPWVLDFNRAYNPSCAYGDPERFACPVTPADNRLDVAIRAGERGYHDPADDAAPAPSGPS